ncbi:MAG: hypothetical protein A2Y97_13865 [Nitrospirae bacterium RBG_13_39_12]|nr:MAG: hypothetical protein A2Y97_13865 [Nitrospirae bacterium RBG_13_39_12]
MNKKWFLIILVTIGILGFDINLYGEEPGSSKEPMVIRGAYQSEPVVPRVFDRDLRDMPERKAWKEGDPIVEIPRRLYPKPKSDFDIWNRVREENKLWRDPLLDIQEDVINEFGPQNFILPDLNFEGMSFTGAYPPDTVGDVGPNHYIQMVNSSGGAVFSIYNKSGVLQAGPLTLGSLSTGRVACASGYGDPIVLYDILADRWLMSEFASTGNHLCVYISQTSDPVSGGWFLYDFAVPQFPDYPKYAAWPDAYYVSTNEATSAAYALDRVKMLNGQPATYQRFTAPDLPGFGFNALIPSDVDGSAPPPVGSSNYFMRHRDDEIHNPGANDPNHDFVEIWKFHVDFTNPLNSTFTGPINIPISEFDSHLCGVGVFNCIPQPGTTTRLDPVSEVIMWRLQYRNFGAYETLVGNFVVDVDGTDHAGIRWFELRSAGNELWTLFQEGTYAPDQSNRWMGSIAMDKDGNIALGYSVSSNTVFPSIRYAGRLVSDPMGTLPQGEATIIDGAFSQKNTNRWGDYSSMNVDPVDDCTFWYTQEYVATNTSRWGTRIASFSFPSCQQPGNQPPVAEANGPYNGVAGSPISFSSAGSYDPDGSIVSYLWTFGDNTQPSNEPNPTHTYATAGVYTATLTVTDNQGATGTDTATVNVVSGGNQPPVAEANGPYSGVTGSPISFSSAGSYDPDGSIVSYLWTFGDNTRPSNLPNPTHTYSTAGGYTATLTVKDNQGATRTDTTSVTVTSGN